MDSSVVIWFLPKKRTDIATYSMGPDSMNASSGKEFVMGNI